MCKRVRPVRRANVCGNVLQINEFERRDGALERVTNWFILEPLAPSPSNAGRADVESQPCR